MRLLAVLFVVAFVLFVFPHGIHGDGTVRLEAIMLLLEQGKISTMKYYFIGPLLATPLYLLGYVVKNPTWWCARYNALLFFGMLWFLYRHWKPFLTPMQIRNILICLLGATMFAKHLGDFYGEVFTVVTYVVGISLVLADRPIWGLSFIVLGTWNTPIFLPPMLVLVCALAWVDRRPWYLASIVVAVFLFLGENYLRFGTWMHQYGDLEKTPPSLSPYSNLPGFSYPLFFGLLSVLLSFGKGLVFFIPGFFAYLWARARLDWPLKLLRLCDYLCIISFVLILFYAKWSHWFGGWFWGPRFFLLLCIPAAIYIGMETSRSPKHFWKAWSLLLLTFFSFYVGANGIAFDQSNLEACGGENLGFLCLYLPEFSVLWRPFVVAPGWHAKQIAYLIFFAVLCAVVTKPLIIYCWKRTVRRFSRGKNYLLDQVSRLRF